MLNTLPELSGKVLFEKRSIFDLKEKFDYVLCTEVLEHLEEWEKALEVLKSITNKKLIITVPNERCGFCEGHYRNYTPELLQKFGGQVIETQYHFNFVII
jgi:2-polyprenyl-3-methyl-5-hydroxy-6-metoxy-1,4-benzoquinol methylase